MQVERLSPSSYKVWEFCQQQFFIEQKLKYRYPPGKAADIGTATHKILEIMALVKIEQQKGEPEPTIKIKDETINLRNYNIDELLDISIQGFKPGYFDESDKNKIRQYIDTALTINEGGFDPRNLEIISPEKRCSAEFSEEWARTKEGDKNLKVGGIIDLVVQRGENEYEVIDWKTGALKDFYTGKVKTYRDFYDDIQLRIYHYMFLKMFGEDCQCTASIVFLKENKFFTIPFDKTDVAKTLHMVKEKYEEMKRTKIPKRNITWRCKKFCPFGKNDTRSTKMPMMEQEMPGGIAKAGEIMSICDCVDHHNNLYGIDWVEANLGKYKK